MRKIFRSTDRLDSVSSRAPSVIYFAPVKPEFFDKWEYYQCDLEMLKKTYDKVLVCHSFWCVLKFVFGRRDVFCWWWHLSAPVIVLSRILGRRVFCTGAIHMFDCSGAKDFYTKSTGYRLLTKFGLRLANINIFISHDQELSITSHLSVNRPTTIHSSLLPDKSSLIMEQVIDRYRKAHPSTLRFLFLCWLTSEQLRRKGFFLLLEAFSRFIRQTDPTAKLIIAGKSGNGVSAIGSAVERLGISANIELWLDLPDADKVSLYCESDLFISPSYMEGFGNASLESMSYGLPVVVTRYGASHEVVGETGYIINSIDVDSINCVMRSYYSLGQSARLAMRAAAFKRAHELFGFGFRLEKFKAQLNCDE